MHRWKARQVSHTRLQPRTLKQASDQSDEPTVTLDWWASSGLPVRYSKQALHSLSRTGNVRLLDWWKSSRFKLDYDKEVIIIATRHGQTSSLTWWLESGLDLEYRFFDIEAALEDAVVGDDELEAVRQWWEALGYDVSMNASEWSRLRNLKTQRKPSPTLTAKESHAPRANGRLCVNL